MEKNENRHYIRQWMRVKNIGVMQLANMMGCTRQALHDVLTRDIRLSSLCKIAAVLGVEPWQLLTEPDDDREGTELFKISDKEDGRVNGAACVCVTCPACGRSVWASVCLHSM